MKFLGIFLSIALEILYGPGVLLFAKCFKHMLYVPLIKIFM